jgi:D-alanyl-D-alanine carboxypeptidase
VKSTGGRRDSVSGRRRIAFAALLGVLAVVLPGCGGDSSSTSPPVDRVADEIASAGAAGVIVYVSDDGREFAATAGTRRPDEDARFRIGSVSKTFTATIVLLLAEEGRLGFGDTLERYLPGVVPQGDRITIRQLLNHRSGLSNVTDYEHWLDRASRSASTRPIDVLRFAASHPPTFAPGSGWGYSNTNYIALGLVIEEATGHTYRQELEQRILEPLGLESTELPRTRQLQDLDDEGDNPNVPWAAGAIVSNAKDLSRFFAALLSGEILSKDSLAQMKQTVIVGRAGGDGLGIFATELPCGRFWGHDGGILDYGTIVKASEDGDRIAVTSVQGGAPSGPRPDETALLCPSEATARAERSIDPRIGPPGAMSRWSVLCRSGQRREIATSSRRSIASCIPASIPDSMIASRTSLFGACTRTVRVVRPSASVSVIVFRVPPSGASGGAPSKISVETIRSLGTISRYSPWKATSNPPSVVTMT